MKMEPKARKSLILIAAVRVARRPGGWSKLTRIAIAREADCANGLVSKYLGDMQSVRRHIMAHAIKHEYIDLIAQGIATNYPACRRLSPILKHKAINCLMSVGE